MSKRTQKAAAAQLHQFSAKANHPTICRHCSLERENAVHQSTAPSLDPAQRLTLSPKPVITESKGAARRRAAMERANDAIESSSTVEEAEAKANAAPDRDVAAFEPNAKAKAAAKRQRNIEKALDSTAKALGSKATKATVAKLVKKAKAVKTVPPSKTPERKRARRIIREFLRLSLIASDEHEAKDVRDAAQVRLTYLEQYIDAALKLQSKAK